MITNNPVLMPDAYLSWVEVDLEAVRYNYRTIRSFVASDVSLFPVIKADAYGHGAIEVATVLAQEGAERICVARVEEGVALRHAGIKLKILVFTPPLPPQAALAAKYNLEVVVCDENHIRAVTSAHPKPRVHIKTDLGMGRIGCKPSGVHALLSVCQAEGIEVLGIMSHFPCADGADRSVTESMIKTFTDLRDTLLKSKGSENLFFHLANTAGVIRFPDSWFNAVRSGIAIYGQYPSVEMERPLTLKPAMTLKTRIVYVKEVPVNTPISYSHTYKTRRPSKIATLALGYADGYPRHASNLTEFLVHGKLAPQVGRVCMDLLMIDVTEIPEAEIGSEVIAFGHDSGNTLSAEHVAARFDSLGYELTTRIGKRLPRFYIKDGVLKKQIESS